MERENDPEDLVVQQMLKVSMETFKQEQATRDAQLARTIAATPLATTTDKTGREMPPTAGAAASAEVEYDGSIEHEHDPEDLAVQHMLRASMETFKQEQTDRDAQIARQLAAQGYAEGAVFERDPPKVVGDGTIERFL
ncbi:hypothetical protein AB1Y20_020458 [Prymnesium parvum]